MTPLTSPWRSFICLFLLLSGWTLAAQDEHWRARYYAGAAAANEGRYAEARELLREAWAEAQYFSPTDLARGLAAQSLATVLLVQDDMSQAEPLFLESKSVFESAGPDGRFPLAQTLDGLGELRLEQGRYVEAEQLLKEGLSLNRALHGENHLLTAQSYRHLGELYEVLNRIEDAEHWLESSLKSVRADPAPPAGALSIALEALARVYLAERRYGQARSLLQEALEAKRAMGQDHPGYADVLVLMGALYRLQGDPARAEPILKKALAIYDARGDWHRFAAQTQLAGVALAERKYSTAERYLSEVLTSLNSKLGPEHLSVASIGSALGQVYFADGRYDRARLWLDKSLELQRRILGQTHPEVAKTLSVLAAVNARLHESDEAGRQYREALEVYAKTVPPDHPGLAATQQAYARFLKSARR